MLLPHPEEPIIAILLYGFMVKLKLFKIGVNDFWYLKEILDFEVIWEEPKPDINGKFHIGGIGNLQQTLLGYKMCKVYGSDKISYLSNTYQDSDYLYECARGGK